MREVGIRGVNCDLPVGKIVTAGFSTSLSYLLFLFFFAMIRYAFLYCLFVTNMRKPNKILVAGFIFSLEVREGFFGPKEEAAKKEKNGGTRNRTKIFRATSGYSAIKSCIRRRIDSLRIELWYLPYQKVS